MHMFEVNKVITTSLKTKLPDLEIVRLDEKWFSGQLIKGYAIKIKSAELYFSENKNLPFVPIGGKEVFRFLLQNISFLEKLIDEKNYISPSPNKPINKKRLQRIVDGRVLHDIKKEFEDGYN